MGGLWVCARVRVCACVRVCVRERSNISTTRLAKSTLPGSTLCIAKLKQTSKIQMSVTVTPFWVWVLASIPDLHRTEIRAIWRSLSKVSEKTECGCCEAFNSATTRLGCPDVLAFPKVGPNYQPFLNSCIFVKMKVFSSVKAYFKQIDQNNYRGIKKSLMQSLFAKFIKVMQILCFINPVLHPWDFVSYSSDISDRWRQRCRNPVCFPPFSLWLHPQISRFDDVRHFHIIFHGPGNLHQ